MLLLPVATHELAGPLLALASTLAGNLLIVGSIANIIVVDAAQARGVRIDWLAHLRVGLPVTLATLGITALTLWTRAAESATVDATPRVRHRRLYELFILESGQSLKINA